MSIHRGGKGLRGDAEVVAFPGKHPRAPGGLHEKKTPKLPPKLPSPTATPLAPAGTSNPLFSQFHLILAVFSAVFPRRALLFPPKWSCGRLCPWIQHFSGQERLPEPTLGAAFLGLLLDFGGFAFFFFLFHVFLASSPELGQAGSDSAALLE